MEQKKKRKKTGINTKAKKKQAVARAVVRKGTGKVKINNRNLQIMEPFYVRRLIEEPIVVAGDVAKEYDIEVNVHGGGFMGQAVASRGAIAKALVEATKDKTLKARFRQYDRMMLVDDVRRVESKKPLGTKARKKKQKSKR